MPIITFAQDRACRFPDFKSPFADAGKRLMPPLPIVTALAEKDWLGTIFSQVLLHSFYMTNRSLEQKIDKKRPCGCSGALPSGHMIMYTSSASFLHYRYGWKVAFPAYVMAFGFTYDRVQAKAHSWVDVLTTAAAVNLITYFVTPKFTRDISYWPWTLKISKKKKKAPQPLMRVVPTLEYGKNLTMLGVRVGF